MTEKQRKKIVYIIFVGAVIYGAVNFIGNDNKDKPNSGQSTPQTIARIESPPSSTIDWDEFEKLDWGRDPFYRAKAAVHYKVLNNSDAQLVLNGILYNELSPTAVINKKIVKVGDRIENAVVLQIDKDKVIVKKPNGSKIELFITKGQS